MYCFDSTIKDIWFLLSWFWYFGFCCLCSNIAKGTTDPRVEFCFIKETSLGHITNSSTNLDQISSLESWPSWSDHASTSKSSIRISTKSKPYKINQASGAKYLPNFNFKSCLSFMHKFLTKPCAQSLKKKITLWSNFRFQICTKHVFQHRHLQQWQPQQVLSCHLHTPGSHQSSLLNRSQLVS